jgi:hypothetical protein
VDEHPSEVVRVLLDSIVEVLDVFPVEESKYAFLELSASFARNDLNEPNLFLDSFVDNASKSTIDIPASIVNLVQVQLELHDIRFTPPGTARPSVIQEGNSQYWNSHIIGRMYFT